MESVSTSKHGDHSHSHPAGGFVDDDHMALVVVVEAHMGHHSGGEEVVLEIHMGRHMGGAVEDNHPCAVEEEACGAYTHCGHSNHGEEGNARGNGHDEGCIREVGLACRNHPWEGTHGEVSGTGTDHAWEGVPPGLLESGKT